MFTPPEFLQEYSDIAFNKVKLYICSKKILLLRVPPTKDEDSETFTPVHPDVMSAPEMEAVIKNCKSRLFEVSKSRKELLPQKLMNGPQYRLSMASCC